MIGKNDQKIIQKKLADAVIKNNTTVPTVEVGMSAETTVEQLESERQRILDAIKIKNLDAIRYDQLVESLVRLTHDIQLLAGKPTEITLEEQLDAEDNDLNNRIRAIETRIGDFEGQGEEAGVAAGEVSEGQPGQTVYPERED